MIRLDVLSYNGKALPNPLAATLDETGGTIGRADGNQLVLPDPERTVSRVHAQVVLRGAAYALVDRGSNPVVVNGRSVGHGQEAALRDGDEIHIGGYAIRVTVTAPAGVRSADPFADLGFAPAPPAPASDPFAALGFAPPAPAAAPTVGIPDDWDPFAPPSAAPAPPAAAAFGASPPAQPAPASDPFAALGFAPPAPAAAPTVGIPDDWDPFAPPSAAPAPPAARPRGDFGLDLGAAAPPPLAAAPSFGGGAGESLDALFGLGTAGSGDPLANSKLEAPIAQPNMAASSDPLRSLNSVTRASAVAAPDQVSDLQRAFVAPRIAPPPPEPPPEPPAGSAVLSWDEAAGTNLTVIRPRGPTPAPVAAQPAAGVAPPAPVAPSAAVAGAGADALTAAFCQGLGVALPGGAALTPATMRLVGELLHEATRGTVELLIARNALKREVRADMTKIVARENNPLKFSPSAEVAINHLLGPQARGFMAPAPAMRDAYDDLKAHQVAFLAGMRAALEGVLKRFDPAVLETKLAQKSSLSSLLPSGRKARLWEVFQALYEQISSEASDDFHELFGREFLRAYEAQIDALKKDTQA